MASNLRDRAAQGASTLRQFDERVAEQTTPPDVNASDVKADLSVPVHVAWSHVMADVQWIGKGRSPGLNYMFRGIDAIRNTVGPILRKHGVMVIPVKVVPEYTTVTSAKGAILNYCRATVNYQIIGPQGDLFPVVGEAQGEAFDTGDKASTKAQSIAERTFYITALAIPTDQPEMDTEHGVQHELAAPPPPTPAQYYERITNPRTSIAALQQIRAEFAANPDMAGTLIEEPDGESRKLSAILTREGRQRQAASGGGAS